MRTCLLLLLVLITLLPVGAAEPKPTPPKSAKPAEAAKPKSRPFNGTIKSFDGKLKVLTLQGPKAQTFAVISETKINKDGKPSTTEALIAGEIIGGYARQTPNGQWEALTLNVGKKPTKPAESKPAPTGADGRK